MEEHHPAQDQQVQDSQNPFHKSLESIIGTPVTLIDFGVDGDSQSFVEEAIFGGSIAVLCVGVSAVGLPGAGSAGVVDV